MSGGDDLGSDDDDLLDQSWAKHDQPLDAFEDDELVGSSDAQPTNELSLSTTKRKIPALESNDDNQDADDTTSTSKKKAKVQKMPTTGRKLLLAASKSIENDDTEVQAAYLWTCFTHSLLQAGETPEGIEKFTKSNFFGSSRIEKSEGKIRPKSMASFLKGGALSSMKRLKKWKLTGNPMVVIVCISARRAVQVLKEISSLNCRAAKLFSKHMDIKEQTAMLSKNSYSIAVGTPNRLLKLFKTRTEDDSPALSLEFTELFVIDCHKDNKDFTVFTMNDTAPDLMKFIQLAAVPEIKKGTFKFAMF